MTFLFFLASYPAFFAAGWFWAVHHERSKDRRCPDCDSAILECVIYRILQKRGRLS